MGGYGSCYASAENAVTELLIVLILIAFNGLFALSELAVVSARHSRLKSLAALGTRGAQRALDLAANPSKFLSAVQIGITLISIVNGVYSGAIFGDRLAHLLSAYGLAPHLSNSIGYAVVIVIITYLSVIIGELVPKTLALRNPEKIACMVAPAMSVFSRVASPAVWLLDTSTRLVFHTFGISMVNEKQVTDEEIQSLIAEAENAGVLEKGEREMISGVMRFADRAVIGLMTPRTDVDWIDITAPQEEIKERLITTPHSRLPVGEGSPDSFIGVVQTREILADILAGKQLDISTHVRKAPVIPELTDALDVLRTLREADVPMALIHDEYGNFEGLVTPADILETIVGVFRSDTEGEEPHATERPDGTWLLSGSMAVDEMAQKLEIVLPEERGYETVAGFVLSGLQHLPKVGESTELLGWKFEVVDLDGRRVDKVLATRARQPLRRQI